MTASHRTIPALVGAAWLCLGAGTALAASPQEERWDMLRDMYFSGRTVEDAGPLLSLEAPKRANDAAVVPVRIVTAPGAGIQVTAVHLIVDGNPVPLAATFRFAQGNSPQTIDTRLRVDAYTNITAVATTSEFTIAPGTWRTSFEIMLRIAPRSS